MMIWHNFNILTTDLRSNGLEEHWWFHMRESCVDKVKAKKRRGE